MYSSTRGALAYAYIETARLGLMSFPEIEPRWVSTAAGYLRQEPSLHMQYQAGDEAGMSTVPSASTQNRTSEKCFFIQS